MLKRLEKCTFKIGVITIFYYGFGDGARRTIINRGGFDKLIILFFL